MPWASNGSRHAPCNSLVKLQQKQLRAGARSRHPEQLYSGSPLDTGATAPPRRPRTRPHTVILRCSFRCIDNTGPPRAPVTLPYTPAARLALGARALLHLARQRRLHALVLLLLVQQLGAQVRNLRLHVRVAARQQTANLSQKKRQAVLGVCARASCAATRAPSARAAAHCPGRQPPQQCCMLGSGVCLAQARLC